ncbi:hypothetical protein [Sporomusa sp. KB1]|jgi:hypothetical protein|uniref:phage tail tube protein n=1 Tax=Sporomusa sp. KB1 TaxID=943346 RepID=UPI0011AA53BB|nr:hypothetical protein [Sporomusa sp. KB1]TWH48553.1 hypothetical protein Salpa_4718 [Sporomusa sp. KB1]
MSTPSAKNLYIGSGQVFFDRFDDDDNRTGLRHLGNVPKFNLKTDVTKVEKKSSMNAAKSTYDEAVTDKKASADLTIEEFDPANLALALYGTEGIINQAAKIVVNEKQKAQIGRYIQLNTYNISNIKVKRQTGLPASIDEAVPFGTLIGDGMVTSGGLYTGTAIEDYYVTVSVAPTALGAVTGCKIQWKKGLSGVFGTETPVTASAITLELGIQVTFHLDAGQTFAVGDTWKIHVTPTQMEYVAGKDFKTDEVLSRGGLIQIPETSTIPDGTNVYLDYNIPEGKFPKIAANTAKSIRGYMLFLGDPSKGAAYNGEFWKVTITPNGEIPMIGTDYAGFDITVTCLDDSENHPDEPLHRLVKLK